MTKQTVQIAFYIYKMLTIKLTILTLMCITMISFMTTTEAGSNINCFQYLYKININQTVFCR